MPGQLTTAGAAWAIIAFAFDALILFGLARLASLITAVHAARDDLAEAAVTAERVRAADSLRAAIGDRLAEAAGQSAAALQSITGAPVRAREQIAGAAAVARQALGPGTGSGRPVPGRAMARSLPGGGWEAAGFAVGAGRPRGDVMRACGLLRP